MTQHHGIRTYTCASCDEEFESTRSDEAAMAEAKLLWSDVAPIDEEDCDIVCEECFMRIMSWHGKRIGRA